MHPYAAPAETGGFLTATEFVALGYESDAGWSFVHPTVPFTVYAGVMSIPNEALQKVAVSHQFTPSLLANCVES